MPLLFFKNVLRKVPSKKKEVFLTFDDGPIPELTPWVIELLKQYNAKASFFCVGANIKKHQNIYLQLLAEGHAIGNHTYSHLNGWFNSKKDYLEDVEKCQKITNTKLFRPPYGKLTFRQFFALKKKYTLVFWNLLSKDYDPKMSKEKCLNKLLLKTKAGSIIVFHDSLKAKETLIYVLPKYLEHFHSQGFSFSALA